MVYIAPFLWDWQGVPSEIDFWRFEKFVEVLNLFNTKLVEWGLGGLGYGVTEAVLLYLSAKWTPGGHDLARPIMGQNKFLRRLNSSSLHTISNGYHVILSDHWMYDSWRNFIVGMGTVETAIAAGIAAAAYYSGDVGRGIRWTVIAGLKGGSTFWWYDWGSNSDENVWVKSQNLKNIYPDNPNLTIEPEGLKHVMHKYEVKKLENFIHALENPPTLDSIILVEVKEDTVDTTFLTDGSIDTLMASPESCAIYFKLDNVYFLAQTRVTVNINGAKIGDLRYPDYKGYDDRWCRIPERLKNA